MKLMASSIYLGLRAWWFIYLYAISYLFFTIILWRLGELKKIFFQILYLFILAVLGLHWCMGFSLVAVSWGYSLVVMLGLIIGVASLVVEQHHSIVVADGFSCSVAGGIFPCTIFLGSQDPFRTCLWISVSGFSLYCPTWRLLGEFLRDLHLISPHPKDGFLAPPLGYVWSMIYSPKQQPAPLPKKFW